MRVIGPVRVWQDFGERAHAHQIVEGVIGQADRDDVHYLARMLLGQFEQALLLFVRSDALAGLRCGQDESQRRRAVAGHFVSPRELVLVCINDVELLPIKQEFQRPTQETSIARALERQQVAVGHAEHVQLRAPVPVFEGICVPGNGQGHRKRREVIARLEQIVIGRWRSFGPCLKTELTGRNGQSRNSLGTLII
jgi:hypothetical protein